MSTSYTFNARSELRLHDFYGSANDNLFKVWELEDAWDDVRNGPNRWKVLYPADLPEVLSRIEDLWIRIKDHPEFRLHVATDRNSKNHMVLIRPTSVVMDDEAHALLKAVQEDTTYAWTQTHDRNADAESGERGKCKLHSLVSCISWESGVLVVELATLTLLNRQCGCHVESQVQGLLERIQLRPVQPAPLVTKQLRPLQERAATYWGAHTMPRVG